MCPQCHKYMGKCPYCHSKRPPLSTNYLGLLKDFHYNVYKKTGNELAKPGQTFVVGNSVASLRADLNEEECDELNEVLREGPDNGDDPLYALRKEICDLLYVAFGTAVTYGIDIDSDFHRVHQNNLMKIENSTIGPNGKLIKSKSHPKVAFD